MIVANLLLLAASATQDARTLPLAEVEAAKDGATALLLARRVLPAEVADRIVDATVRRQWAPGQVWWIGARETARVAGPDLCEQRGHAVEASAPFAPGDKAPADTVLAIGSAESWTEVAVLPVGTRATPAACEGQAFVSTTSQRDRTIAAYRVLRSAMAAARGRAPLPFAITCKSEVPAACEDARAALADLPMDALFGIGVSCLETQRIRRENIISCPPLLQGQPYQAEIRFGRSGQDGRSWRVSFVHRAGWPETVELRRTTVIYH